MLADRRDGKTYVVRNVCKSYDSASFVTQMQHNLKWAVRVERVNNKARYYDDYTVFSKQDPTNWNPRMMNNITGQCQAVTITEWLPTAGSLKYRSR